MKQTPKILGQQICREDLHPETLEILEQSDDDEEWALACSGGADSVCLFWILLAHFPSRSQSLTILHFDHGLRDGDSTRDADFVRKLAEKMGVNFVCGHGEDLEKANEAELREARMNFFHSEMEHRDIRILLQGHQLDDVAETMLMRMSRGSGSTGLAAPRPVQRFPDGSRLHVRPLLGLGRVRIRQALERCDLDWCEDESNRADDFFRNRIRASVVPALQDVATQDVLEAAARTRSLLQEEDEALHDWSWTQFDALREEQGLRWPDDNLPKAVLRRVFHLWLGEIGHGGRLNAAALQNVIDAVAQRRETRFSLGREAYLCLQPEIGRIEVRRKDAQVPVWPSAFLPVDCRLFLPSGAALQWSRIKVDGDLFQEICRGLRNPSLVAFLNADELSGVHVFHVRQRRPGDRYRSLGMSGESKLQDMLVNRKVPFALRDQLPVVTLPDGRLVWCPGCPASDCFKLVDSNGVAFMLEYMPQ